MSTSGAARGQRVGFALAIASAAGFGLSGIFASVLFDAGWSPLAAVTVRVTFAALVLAPVAIWMLRGRWASVRAAWKDLLAFGLVAVAMCQLAYFLAVQYIAPSLAIVLEFLGPVLLVFWTWARTRKAPTMLTFAGAAVALIGVVAVAGVIGGVMLHPLGIAFGLLSAVGVAVYFSVSANATHGVPPIPFAALGLMVGAVALWLIAPLGILPFEMSAAPTTLVSLDVPVWVTVTLLVLVSTVAGYVLGVGGARRLGPTVASFTGYSEPVFSFVWTALILAFIPGPWQFVGAIAIIAGVVLVKLGEVKTEPRPTTESIDVVPLDPVQQHTVEIPVVALRDAVAGDGFHPEPDVAGASVADVPASQAPEQR